jgi:hypothetical protein
VEEFRKRVAVTEKERDFYTKLNFHRL